MNTIHIAAVELAGLLVLLVLFGLVTSFAAHGLVLGLFLLYRVWYTVQLLQRNRAALFNAVVARLEPRNDHDTPVAE